MAHKTAKKLGKLGDGWVTAVTVYILTIPFAYAASDLATTATVGTVKTSVGAVSILRNGQKITAVAGSPVQVTDRIVTGPDGSVGVTLRDNTLLSAGPNSSLALNKFVFDSTTNAGTVDASLKRGTLSVVSGKIAKQSPDSVKFSTPSATLGVRGTEFIIEAAGTED